MKKLSYQQVIHIKLWITFLFIFQKSLAFYLFMCYNIEKLRNKRKEISKVSMNVNVYQEKEKFKVILSDEYITKRIKLYDNLSDVYDFAKEMSNRYNTFVSVKFRKNLVHDELTGTHEEISLAYELINTAIELLDDLDEEYRVDGFLMNWEKLRAISYARQDIKEAIKEHKKASYFIEHKNNLSPKHILDCIEITEKRLKA